VSKNATSIGEDCFVGSDTMLVAPVSMGRGATTAAGSVITKDIPDGALGVARERQTNIGDWSLRKSILRDGKTGED
jgi:bifunctional UDP-N-acetylglucosamine pyrophosphorylase/glucosamine-1-phosphate N-acetyltransferase